MSLSRPCVCIHHIDIEISVPVRGKSDFGSVITPDMHKIVSLMEGQLLCLSSLRGNPIKISFIVKYNSRSLLQNGRITQPVRVLLRIGQDGHTDQTCQQYICSHEVNSF